jgi:hypothetical protein
VLGWTEGRLSLTPEIHAGISAFGMKSQRVSGPPVLYSTPARQAVIVAASTLSGCAKMSSCEPGVVPYPCSVMCWIICSMSCESMTVEPLVSKCVWVPSNVLPRYGGGTIPSVPFQSP